MKDQVRLFVDYQTRVALRAIERNSEADLVMIYIEQPDGSGTSVLVEGSTPGVRSQERQHDRKQPGRRQASALPPLFAKRLPHGERGGAAYSPSNRNRSAGRSAQ